MNSVGINVPITLGAGNLARRIQGRGWNQISVGSQLAGDVAVANNDVHIFNDAGEPTSVWGDSLGRSQKPNGRESAACQHRFQVAHWHETDQSARSDNVCS
jgi:hypothetical protein